VTLTPIQRDKFYQSVYGLFSVDEMVNDKHDNHRLLWQCTLDLGQLPGMTVRCLYVGSTPAGQSVAGHALGARNHMVDHLVEDHLQLYENLLAEASAGPVNMATLEQTDHDSVLMEAQRIITGDRRDSYGKAYESFKRIADMWSPTLGIEVTPYQVALCMIQLKVARYVNGQQRDSAVDIAGYAGLLDIIAEHQE
jgi:hypothetical protein